VVAEGLLLVLRQKSSSTCLGWFSPRSEYAHARSALEAWASNEICVQGNVVMRSVCILCQIAARELRSDGLPYWVLPLQVDLATD
jgi:hypothetical protein